MKETGLPFSKELIPKVLEGAETVTRRTWG